MDYRVAKLEKENIRIMERLNNIEYEIEVRMYLRLGEMNSRINNLMANAATNGVPIMQNADIAKQNTHNRLDAEEKRYKRYGIMIRVLFYIILALIGMLWAFCIYKLLS